MRVIIVYKNIESIRPTKLIVLKIILSNNNLQLQIGLSYKQYNQSTISYHINSIPYTVCYHTNTKYH